MRYRTRLARLEAHRPPVTHHTPVIRVPHEIPRDDWDLYLAALPCACGVAGCPARTIGLVLPEILTVEAWERTYGTSGHRRAP
jgi:hypothetical protein